MIDTWMREVAEGITVGAERLCSRENPDVAVVHACKHPCHRQAIGYSGSLSQNHPDYLWARGDSDLYLNIVDKDHQKHRYMEPIFRAALDFIDDHRNERPVRVHCNQGRSRSPSIAMVYLAKRAGGIPDASYEEARSAFEDLYHRYAPGRGLHLYLQDHWADLG